MEKKQKLIQESWERCRQYGIEQNGWNPAEVLTGKELEKVLRDSQELIEAAQLLMQSLYELVASSGFVVVLLNADGYIVEVIGEIMTPSLRGPAIMRAASNGPKKWLERRRSAWR